MKYKYENVKIVKTRRDLEIFKYDDNYELVGTLTVPKGCKGIVESMGCSSTDNFRNCYDVVFIDDDNEISVAIYEEDFEVLLEINN
jgi:hypothetical protein